MNTVSLVHMVYPSRFVSGVRRYCVESRDPVTGNLTTDLNLPFMEADEDRICQYYFRNVPGEGSATQEEIAKWYNDRGWYFRPKTW